MKVKVGYSQGAKVSNPSDRYENASFNVNLGLEFEFEEIPDEANEVIVYRQALEDRMVDEVARLRKQVGEELQKDIDQFKSDNGG